MYYIGLFAALLGLFISLHMYVSSRQKKPLMCPRSSPCERVVGSTFGKTAGIPNTLLGVMYYFLISALYVVALINPALRTASFLLALSLITAVGMIFSAYLVAVQALVLKSWCVWCLGSTAAMLVLTVTAAMLVR